MKIGHKIRGLRQDAGFTIPQISEATGLSKGFISQVENDKASLSLESLGKIAAALQISIADLLAEPALPPELIKKNARPSIKTGDSPEMQILSSAFGRQIQVLTVDLPAGYQTGNRTHTHDGEEFITVMQGKVKVVQGDFSEILEEGDSVHLDGSYPHLCQNASNEVTKILVVLSPPTLLPLSKSEQLVA